jgi:hypothetical protein
LPLPGDFFRHKLTIVCEGRKVTLRANGEFVVVETPGSFDIEVCSINRRDKVFQLESNPFTIPHFHSLPVFSEQPDSGLRQLLNSGALQWALDALQLKNSESMHICRNSIVLYLQREARDDIISAVRAVCDLAKELPALEEHLDLSGLPTQFEGLSDLIKKWAVSDDEGRSEMIERASRQKLKKFVDSVLPYISAINEYLDSYGDEPPPKGATALGTLAECALEAQIRLRDS